MQLEEYKNMFELETTHWWYKTLHKLVETFVAKEFKGNHFKILDAGCGTGRMMEILSKYGEVEGFDYSWLAVSLARNRGLKNVISGDLNEWDSPPNLYDIIISLDVLSCVDNDNVILKKIFNSLKPGATLILNLPAFEILRRQHDVVVNTKKRYRKKNLIKDLTEIGFTIKTASYRQIHLFLFIFFWKIFRGIFRKNYQVKSDLKKSPQWINTILEKIGSIENHLIFRGVYLPFGSSLFIVAKK